LEVFLTLLVESRADATAILTLANPERRNALSLPLRAELADAMERLEADTAVRAIVLTGGPAMFSAGGDISGMNAADYAAGRERFRLTQRLVRLMIGASKPLIAAVEGYAVGAGLSLALCCDTIVASAGARFAASFGRVGLIGDFGLLHTLPRRVGEGHARQILLYGETITAARAEHIGLIDHLVPDGAALDTALARAALFATAAPLPVAMTKAWFAQGLAEALEWERNTQSALFLTADHAEGKAAFLEKRPARFSGV
jgi:enoyl-CoA hydratase/carnithine racemase